MAIEEYETYSLNASFIRHTADARHITVAELSHLFKPLLFFSIYIIFMSAPTNVIPMNKKVTVQTIAHTL